MQGGLQIGMAIITAEAALPAEWAVSGISAWFLSPGEGDHIEADARVEHRVAERDEHPARAAARDDHHVGLAGPDTIEGLSQCMGTG